MSPRIIQYERRMARYIARDLWRSARPGLLLLAALLLRLAGPYRKDQ